MLAVFGEIKMLVFFPHAFKMLGDRFPRCPYTFWSINKLTVFIINKYILYIYGEGDWKVHLSNRHQGLCNLLESCMHRHTNIDPLSCLSFLVLWALSMRGGLRVTQVGRGNIPFCLHAQMGHVVQIVALLFSPKQWKKLVTMYDLDI